MNYLNKKIILIFFILIFFLLNIKNSLAEVNTCEYISQINQCMDANKSGTVKSIEDFVCITGNREEVAYQIILDMEFKKLDEEMDKYLEDLEKVKNRYFGIGAKKNYIDGINDIEEKGEDFRIKYNNICTNTLMKKAISCSNKKDDKSVEIKNAIKYFNNNGSPCKTLVDKKISIFNDVAFNILMLNKLQIKADEKKTYDQAQRSNYDHLLDIMMINLGYIERIWQKWPSKLKNPHQ